MTWSVTLNLVVFFVAVIVQVHGQKLAANPSSAFSASRILDEFVCKEQFSRRSIVGKCEAFIECKNGLAEEKTCPEGLLFNNNAKLAEYACQYASLVNCPKPEPTIVIPEVVPASVRPIAVPGIQTPTISKDFICSKRFGRFSKPGQCDVYFECTNGIAEEKTCPDGLVFNPLLPYEQYPCQYDYLVDCTGRQKYQKPISTEECPHQYGFFFTGDSRKCGTFRSCVNGLAYNMMCPEGLAFNAEDIKCDWPDQVTGCNVEEFLGFRCPEIKSRTFLDEGAINEFYSSKQDCRKYFACVSGKPRLLNCPSGTAFDEISRGCIDIADVASCPETFRVNRA